MTITLRQIRQKEERIWAMQWNQKHRDQSSWAAVSEYFDLQRCEARLQMLTEMYQTQQRVMHHLPDPADPLPVVEVLDPESWKD